MSGTTKMRSCKNAGIKGKWIWGKERRENYDRNLLRCTQYNFVGPKRANKQL